jgi:ABC-type cobalamin/Fe3+-siderophores transport system ATPase subunit
VQRAVLARELAGDINVLIAANPVFGLDFAAVAEIHARIVQVREKGGAVLLIQRRPRRTAGAGGPHRRDERRARGVRDFCCGG